jgi:hypothetical protein
MKQKRPIIYIPDEEITNFMEIRSGNIAPGVLYRSSSPLKGGDTKKVKEKHAIKAGIKCIINLEDDSSNLEYLSKDVPWYFKLVTEKCVIGLPMTFTIPGIVFNEKKLKTALQFMITHESPYLIHCFAGVDRTGFVSALLEALMGASLKEICKDYLLGIYPDYKDSYRPDFYSKIKNILLQLKKMAHGEKLTSINIQTAAEYYLLNDVGLLWDEVSRLKNILSGVIENR